MTFSHPFFLIVRFSCVHGSCLLLMVRQLIVQPISFRACMVHVSFGRVCCPSSLSSQFLLTATSQPSAAQSVSPTFFSPLFWWTRRGESWRRIRPMADDLDCRGGRKRWCWSGYGQTLGRKVGAVVMRWCWNEGMRTCKMGRKMRWKTMKNINKRGEKWSKKRGEINKS